MAASPWRNPVDALDADRDSFVVPADVLKLINDLNDAGARQLPTIKDSGSPFLDVDGDGFIAPIDVLKIINHLNAGNSENGRRHLAESGVLASETTVTISLGQLAGTRSYRVQLDANFDTTDRTAAIEDLLAVYLVDPNLPQQTMLDRGVEGTTVFSLAGTKAEFAPGLARWDGSVLEIDTTSLASRDTGVLKFQLLSSDADSGTRVTIQPLSNEVDAEGQPSPARLGTTPVVDPGGAVNLANLTLATNATAPLENVRFRADTGRYAAELRVENAGEPVGRNVTVVFPGLPAGVALRNASGTNSSGAPYLNL